MQATAIAPDCVFSIHVRDGMYMLSLVLASLASPGEVSWIGITEGWFVKKVLWATYHNIIKCWHEFAGAGLGNHQSNYGTIMSHHNVAFVWYVASYQGDHSVVTTILIMGKRN